MGVPLSEDEQRILQDIERSFYESDPKFANHVSANGLYRRAGRNLKLAGVGFLLSLALLLGSFIRFPVIGLVAFVAMLGCAAVFVRNLRHIGAGGLRDAAESERAKQAGDAVQDFRARLNNRFRRQ